MTERITNAIVHVEQQIQNEYRITNAIVDVEQKITVNYYRVTKAVVMVEYRVENWRHASLPVQMF